MRLYTYRCPVCGKTEEHFRAVAERDRLPSDCWCSTRGGTYPPMVRVITAPAIRGTTVSRP